MIVDLMSHAPNAALSGEQRRPPRLKYDAVTTEVEANQKCRALGIRLKCFVIFYFLQSYRGNY